MNLDFLNTREVALANGDRLSLRDAVVKHMRLEAAIGLEEQEWEVVYHLREVCLGRPIDPAPERFLIREGWLREDGTVDPALRSIALSSVRGEGRLLHLDCPYTDDLSRAIATFYAAREELLAKLDPADAHIVFEKSDLEQRIDAVRENNAEDKTPELYTPPNPDTFVRKLKARMEKEKPPDSPPPPK